MKLWIFGTVQYWRPQWTTKRGLHFLWQKLVHGFSDDETWDLGYTIAKFALPRLKRFREIEAGHPACYTEEQWFTMIDTMIYALDAVIKDGEGNLYSDCQISEDYQKIDRKVQEGLRLLGKNFRGLWW
ncbi:MAG: hypothetical protein ACXAC5_02780 [Promethearchaeota archaeon]|jgi:hypothetical protein